VGIFDRLDRLADQLGDLIVPDDVRTHVELGAAYLDRGDLDAAVHELETALRLRPEHARAAYLLGLAFARRGDDSQAIDALARAAAVRGGFADAHVALGELYRRRGDLDAASDSYRQALDLGVNDPALRGEIYRGLGAAYLSARRYDKAVRELRKAVASLPDDLEAQSLLGRALYLRGDLDAARLTLERAARAGNPGSDALNTLGDLYERLGRRQEASETFERSLDGSDGEIQARLGLARLALAENQPAIAQQHVAKALALSPDRADILAQAARVAAAAKDYPAALTAFDRALVSTAGASPRLLMDRTALVEEALSVALAARQRARAGQYAAALLPERPEHPIALAGAAMAALDGGELDRAQSLVDRALAAADGVEPRLAQAELAIARNQPANAAAALRRAAQLAPSDPRPRERLAEVYRSDETPADLYALLQQAHRHLARTPELAELGPEAGRLVEILDRPLLVTVMGEFNSGKSTFVNALLGEEVAPMGITPTTATINVLKYGGERKGRIVWLDQARAPADVPWGEVPKLLRGLDAAQAKLIDVVEVLSPLETLQRVNVVDTPGLNSIHPEHEETARRFIAEADAVVWLFTVDQAAKATEGEALARIRGEGKKILGVLNKIDRCSAEELEKIISHVKESLGERLETVVPFAARPALEARRKKDDAQLQSSNYPALATALEERFFSRARAIQREAATLRLGALLGRAREQGQKLLDTHRLDALSTALAAVREDAARFRDEFLPAERRRLSEAADQVYAEAARAVLDFVRPRRWAFGSNEAAPADRDFLLGLLDEQLAALFDASRTRVHAELERSLALLRTVEPNLDFAGELALLDEQVYGRFRAFARGWLRGGRVDDFFTRALPKLELSEREIRRALERASPWSDEHAEAELRTPLRAWAERVYAQLASRLERERAQAELGLFDVEARVIAPLESLRARLEKL
jgi:tetratricopeptide (TPR) repeat protein/GTP-binding protein EngB required for normal cell division